LSGRENKIGLIMPTYMCTYPENLVKIGPVHSEWDWSPRGPLKRRWKKV